jgi:PAS domain-containing protein
MKSLRVRQLLLIVVGLVVFHLSLLGPGDAEYVWVPGTGIAIALTAWTGLVTVIPLGIDYLIVELIGAATWTVPVLNALIFSSQIALSWWCYHRLALGTRRLEDPRSATIFLILVPGGLALFAALFTALAWQIAAATQEPFWALTTKLWISRALGILVLVPALLVVVTPLLVRAALVEPEPPAKQPGGLGLADWTFGEFLEVSGLSIATALLGVVLGELQMRMDMNLHLWAFNLLLIVWASLRQGLRGGALAACAGSLTGLVTVAFMGGTMPQVSPFQGIMLAQCSTALLVGASAGWIRASEARYRHVVGHIPVLLYSARLPRNPSEAAPRRGKSDYGPSVLKSADVVLVSSASRQIFDCPPEDLFGPFAAWVERILPADRELVLAALAQLCLQKAAVTCEYRLVTPDTTAPDAALNTMLPPQFPRLPRERWVRNTLTPYHNADGQLAGWEGVIEDITEQRGLAQDLRLTTGILHALIADMPAGVFFIQGNQGRIILVNARARALLGQREDLAAGLAQFSQTYRLQKPDGREYPWAELPVARALREGATCSANDIVVQRPDGRRITLLSWAAPVELAGLGQPNAAVWVLEDSTILPLRGEAARRAQ